MAKPKVEYLISATDVTKAAWTSAMNGLNRLKGAIFNVHTAVVSLATVGFGALVKSSLDSVDALAKASQKIGVATETLAGLRYAAEQSGGSVKGLDEALVKAEKRLGEFASNGGGAAAIWLKHFNFNIGELQDLSPDQLFLRYADAISSLNTRGEQMAAISALMGDESRSLLPLLDEGAAGIEALSSRAEYLGLTLSGVDAQKVVEANDALQDAGKAFEGLVQVLVVKYAPAIEKIAGIITEMTVAVREGEREQAQAWRSEYDALKIKESIYGHLSESELQRLEYLKEVVNFENRHMSIMQSMASVKMKSIDPIVKITPEIDEEGKGFSEAQERKLALEKEYNRRSAEIAQEWDDIWSSAGNRFAAGVGDSVAEAVVHMEKFSDVGRAMEQVFQGVAKQIISTMVEIGIKKAVLSAWESAERAKTTTEVVAMNAAIAASSVAPAAGVSLATAGGNAVPAASGIAAVMAAAAVIGQAHDGISNIPRAGTWMLDGGERVVKPSDNKKLSNFLDRQESSGQPTNVNVTIHAIDAQGVEQLLTSQSSTLVNILLRAMKEKGGRL
ncbi:MAG: hypothetical protein OEY64_03310 [Nitrospinota bacterium]|nr:hypothetical protein [Nitrospinota bacterium]